MGTSKEIKAVAKPCGAVDIEAQIKQAAPNFEILLKRVVGDNIRVSVAHGGCERWGYTMGFSFRGPIHSKVDHLDVIEGRFNLSLGKKGEVCIESVAAVRIGVGSRLPFRKISSKRGVQGALDNYLFWLGKHIDQIRRAANGYSNWDGVTQ